MIDENKKLKKWLGSWVMQKYRNLTNSLDQWEEEGIFPAHDLFKKMGSLGLKFSVGFINPLLYMVKSTPVRSHAGHSSHTACRS